MPACAYPQSLLVSRAVVGQGPVLPLAGSRVGMELVANVECRMGWQQEAYWAHTPFGFDPEGMMEAGQGMGGKEWNQGCSLSCPQEAARTVAAY